MANRFTMKKLFLLMSAAGSLTLSQYAMASAFQLWEQDAASIGNYHAGMTSEAADASTAFYNPAGLVRIKNQQVIAGGDAVLTDFRYKGTVAVSELNDTSPQPVQAQGGGFNFVPFVHYAAPISDHFVFGFSVVVPYGLQTDYGSNTILRYAATLTSVKVIDITPSLGIAFNDKFSVGFGIDTQRIAGDFNQAATGVDGSPLYETQSTNTGNGSAYGYHLGALFQMSPDTRIGIGYHSQVVHHLKGTSNFVGQLANDGLGGTQTSNNLETSATLPPSTTVSLFHTINPTWDVMGSVTYTQWSVFKNLILNNVAGIDVNHNSTNNLQVFVVEQYRNSWSYSVGANYHVNNKWMFRGGLGYDETPSNNRFRNVQLPDSDRIAAALGAHFQATETIGFDAGWTHIFAMNTRINNLSQQVGPELVTTNGTVHGGADVYGLQVKWDIL
jgi:long-chain fatty acid transport protein